MRAAQKRAHQLTSPLMLVGFARSRPTLGAGPWTPRKDSFSGSCLARRIDQQEAAAPLLISHPLSPLAREEEGAAKPAQVCPRARGITGSYPYA
jgi:hypothetical protein